jgi:hypothetical protein
MNTPPSSPRFNIVFVIGVGRSGSTLLGRLLDNHPDVVDVGELMRLEQAIEDPASKCSCGMLASECPDWNALIRGVPERVRLNYKKWTPELLNVVRQNAGKKVLVDVSKTRGYRLAKRWRDPNVGFIFLARDPRGIFRSFIENGTDDLMDRLKMHKKWLKRCAAFAEKRKDRCHVMHYEDMVTSPDTSLRAVCDFIGIPFVPEVTSPEAKLHHLATYSGSSYLKGTGTLKLDERWKREMKPEDIATISNYLKSIPIYRDRYDLAKTG